MRYIVVLALIHIRNAVLPVTNEWLLRLVHVKASFYMVLSACVCMFAQISGRREGAAREKTRGK